MSNETQDPKAEIENDTPDLPENEATETPEVSEIDALKAELEASKKEHLYLRAEFDNFRKQSIKERSDLMKFGGEYIARDLLNALDVFEKALEMEVTSENFQSFLDGVKLTEKELKAVFTKHGINEIDCKHKPFNPEQAEALSQVPSPDLEEGSVYDVMRKGYLYHDKVLRHAQVVIATKPPESGN